MSTPATHPDRLSTRAVSVLLPRAAARRVGPRADPVAAGRTDSHAASRLSSPRVLLDRRSPTPIWNSYGQIDLLPVPNAPIAAEVCSPDRDARHLINRVAHSDIAPHRGCVECLLRHARHDQHDDEVHGGGDACADAAEPVGQRSDLVHGSLAGCEPGSAWSELASDWPRRLIRF